MCCLCICSHTQHCQSGNIASVVPPVASLSTCPPMFSHYYSCVACKAKRRGQASLLAFWKSSGGYNREQKANGDRWLTIRSHMCDALQVIKCLPTSQGCPDTQLWQKYRAGISAKLAGMDSTKCNRVMIWCLNPGQGGPPYACVRYSQVRKFPREMMSQGRSMENTACRVLSIGQGFQTLVSELFYSMKTLEDNVTQHFCYLSGSWEAVDKKVLGLLK